MYVKLSYKNAEKGGAFWGLFFFLILLPQVKMPEDR